MVVCSHGDIRCTSGDFYVALGSNMSLALLVWVGGCLLKRFLYFFGSDSSLGRKTPILHLPRHVMADIQCAMPLYKH